jgi:hypothetical protein
MTFERLADAVIREIVDDILLPLVSPQRYLSPSSERR